MTRLAREPHPVLGAETNRATITSSESSERKAA